MSSMGYGVGKLKEEIGVKKMRQVEAPLDDEIGQTESTAHLAGLDDVQTPTDYPCAFTLYLTDRTMLLWAKTRQERSYWVDAFMELL